MKIPNAGFKMFLSGSAGRVYQLQNCSSCRMRYLHYPTLENTCSIKKLRTHATAGLISYLSISYLLAKVSELLIQRLGTSSHKCVVAEISVCSDIVFINRIAEQKIRVEKIELELIMSDIAIGYLGALTFLANLKNFMVTVRRMGTF